MLSQPPDKMRLGSCKEGLGFRGMSADDGTVSGDSGFLEFRVKIFCRWYFSDSEFFRSCTGLDGAVQHCASP